jgi:hypothetical protein
MGSLKLIKKMVKQTGLVHYYHSMSKRCQLGYESLLLKQSPSMYANYRYRKIYNKNANLKNPTTSDEKLLWLNLYWKHPLKTECADKYTMRLYVEKHGFGHVLPEIFGVYNSVNEIDFETLPDKFVLKCTHGCGFNIFCDNKVTLDIAETKRKLDRWMSADYSIIAGELHYSDMTPRIICETFLDDLVTDLPIDYKVYCFYGKVHCILVVKGRDFNGHNVTSDFYDKDWKTKLPYYTSSLNTDRNTPRPESLDEMIEVSEALSKPFPFVRMDFYNIRGKAVLGEMTFTPGGCITSGYTTTAQNILGSLIELPEKIM